MRAFVRLCVCVRWREKGEKATNEAKTTKTNRATQMYYVFQNSDKARRQSGRSEIKLHHVLKLT